MQSVVAYGTDMTFTTPSTSTPQVKYNYGIRHFLPPALQSEGFLTSLGSATSVNVYIEYGTTTSYGTTTAATPATMTATGTFHFNSSVDTSKHYLSLYRLRRWRNIWHSYRQ